MNKRVREIARRYFTLVVASVIMALSYRTFVEWGGLYPGGATGLSILFQRIVQRFCDATGWNVTIPFSPINCFLNAIPVWIGFKYIGKRFTFRSVVVIVLLGVFTDMMPVDAITSLFSESDLLRIKSDPFVTSLFGGIVFGFGMALCLRCNATTGGTDFIAIYLSEKKGRETWNIILAFNACILLAGGYIFGWRGALYSIVYQFVMTQVVHLMYRAYQHQTLFVVTSHPEKICKAIYRLSHHGATIIDAHGSYSGERKGIVYSVVAATDTARIYALCKTIDPGAFIGTMNNSRVIGRFYLQPRD